jgi:hypothetical protein
MVTDKLEQSLQVGDPVIWANYGRLYMGVVIKLTARKARLKNIFTGGEHQPYLHNVVKVEALPKACLFTAIKGA